MLLTSERVSASLVLGRIGSISRNFRNGSRLCENSTAHRRRRKFFSTIVLDAGRVLTIGNATWKNFVLYIVPAREFSHSLGHSRPGRADSRSGLCLGDAQIATDRCGAAKHRVARELIGPLSQQIKPLPYDVVALVLQGGGALGAYQAGVYEGLHEVGIRPNWLAGISIGALNAAIIAGSPEAERVERLREFWETICAAPSNGPRAKGWPMRCLSLSTGARCTTRWRRCGSCSRVSPASSSHAFRRRSGRPFQAMQQQAFTTRPHWRGRWNGWSISIG